MALFTDGQVGTTMETASNLSAWTGVSGATVTTDVAHHGSNSMLIDAYEYAYKDVAAQSEIYFRAYVNFGALTDGNTRLLLLRNGGTAILEVYYLFTGGVHYFRVYNMQDGSSLVGFYEVELSVDTWYAVEVKYIADTDGTDGEVSLKLNDIVRISSTTEDFNQTTATRVFCISDAYTGTEVRFDCVVIDTSPIGLESAGGLSIPVAIHHYNMM